MSEEEFQTYRVFFDREPDVAARLDWWGGHLLAAILNQWRKGTPIDADEVTPDRWGDRMRERQGSFVDRLKAWAASRSALAGE